MTYRKQRRFRRGLVQPWRRYPPELGDLAMKALPKAERMALIKLVDRAYAPDVDGMRRAVRDLAVVRYRARQKAQRDARTDVRRRTLVGARLPRETAERVRLAAQLTGRSVYRFVADAIDRELNTYAGE